MKSKKLFAALLAGALTLGAIPLTSFNATTAMEGENLNPSECISESIVQYNGKIYKADQKEFREALTKGYVSVPNDPNKPIKALTEEEVKAKQEANANPAEENKSAIIDVLPYKGNPKGTFAFLKFSATTGDKTFKPHYTTYKALKGKLDTNEVIYCLQMHKQNPPSGSKMEQVAKMENKFLYLIRLGAPRGATDRVPPQIRECFYTGGGDTKRLWNYYITQVAIWCMMGDTSKANLQKAQPNDGAPRDMNDKVIKFMDRSQQYGPQWAEPRLWINHERKEAVTDTKDPSQLCTPNYELDVAPMDEPRECLKLMERNVFTDLGEKLPPTMDMTFEGRTPPGLRVLVYDKKAKRDRVYQIDQGQTPKLYGQDQFRFIIPNPKESGEFKYKIKGPCWTWSAYKYKSGDYQNMMSENVINFGKDIQTAGTIFWKVKETPPTPQEKYYSIKAMKVDEETNAPLPGAEFELTKPNGDKIPAVTGQDGVAIWGRIPERDTQVNGGRFTVTETRAPEGYTLPTEASQVVTLPAQDGDTVTITFKDKKKVPGSFELTAIKKDEADKKPLQGAEFTLTKPDGTKDTGVSNADGIVTFSNLTLTGKYILEETRAPQGYELAQNPRQEIDVTDPKNPPTTMFEFLNKKIPEEKLYDIVATKVDAADKKPLQGATFELTGPNNFKQEAISGEDGTVKFEKLQEGEYTLTETKAPEGYLLANNPSQKVMVPGQTRNLVFENEKIPDTPKPEKPIKGKLELTKVDISDGKPLPNAHFIIYDENKNQITKGVTDDNGIATFELGAGKYYYQEYDAPVGYQLDSTLFPFEIKTDGEIVKCRMTNVPKPVPMLPTTGASVAAGGGLIAAVGAVASVIFKRWL